MNHPIKKCLFWIFTLSLCGILPAMAQNSAYDAFLQELTLKCEANLKSLEGSEQLAELKKACRDYQGDHHV